MNKILITPRSLTRYGLDRVPELQSLRERFELVSGPAGMTPSAEQLAMLVPGCVGWLAGVEAITAPVLEAATTLKIISRNTLRVGSSRVDNGDAEPTGCGQVDRVGADTAQLALSVDAFDCEPPRVSELLKHPRVIATPHLGAFTTAGVRNATQMAVKNLLAALEVL